MKKISITLLAVVLLSSCVSKKKYVALETENGQIKSELTKTKVANEELEAKFNAIQTRVDQYNKKINSLTEEGNAKLVQTDGTVISENTKKNMRMTLKKVPPAYFVNVKTLKDSMNLAVSYNLKNSMDTSTLENDDDISININETVVMITISDKMLFNSASYKVSDKANDILQKIANVINSEPSVEVMVEGHTDSQSIKTANIADNWDLSVLRATSVVRKLQDDYGVAPEKLIASGRSFYHPLGENDTKENRAINRRTRIVILPNIDKFFALMASKE
jgi:chemotaxis protein MotB